VNDDRKRQDSLALGQKVLAVAVDAVQSAMLMVSPWVVGQWLEAMVPELLWQQ
jgi:hypothetical protein